jgi:hypothetical protein
VKYWQRCQALLQWGQIAASTDDDFSAINVQGNATIKFIHRFKENTNIYFVANTSHHTGTATCSFKISGMQPELWDPVTGSIRNLSQFKDYNGKTSLALTFDDAQSFFIVFRNKVTEPASSSKSNFPTQKEVITIHSPWQVTFDSAWGGPARPVTFTTLEDWIKRSESAIKYFSGTAIYLTSFDVSPDQIGDIQSVMHLDLGVVKHVARVLLNNKDLGVVWTAPWNVKLPAGLLKNKDNQLVIEITNVWANRLIGDEQEPADCEWLPGHYFYNSGTYLKEFPDWFVKKQPRPSKGRYCFTTWNYFSKDSPLVSSGLLGPVRIMKEE